jgi:hypothetical protein
MNDNGTLKVTPITSAASQQAHATFTITAMVDGFPVSIAVEGKADALRGMIDRLKAIGATPPVQTPARTASKASNADGAPKCPTHRSPMKSGRKGYFCPRQTDGEYCDQVA